MSQKPCENPAQKIADCCTSIEQVLEYEKYLGGKYILLFECNGVYYIQGDATCSVSVFYSTQGPFVCASNFQLIAQIKQYPPDEAFLKIRQSGDISQAMPYDITHVRQIKQLIPNHYLNIGTGTAVRFVNEAQEQKVLSVEQASQITMPMIERLLVLYQRHYKLYCPITSGRDSRVVLAFLRRSGAEFSCYTIRHPEHNDATQDICLPIALCKQEDLTHRLIEDVTVSEPLKQQMDTLLGKDNYSQRTLRIAQTIYEKFGDGAIINGDIIGQVGKCSLHRDIPSMFATPAYFRCKLHNYSRGAKVQLKYWLKEIKESGEKVNTFDLFSVENRMGRWAGQENLIYNSLGQVYLNIFNSRSIIYTWTATARKERKKSALHVCLIEKTCPSLLQIPFEKDESFLFTFSKATGMNYLLSSYLKYYLEKMKFLRGKRG